VERVEGKFVIAQKELCSPPLVPDMTKVSAMQDMIPKVLNRWLECFEFYDDIDWSRTFFRVEYGKPWPRVIVEAICKYYHQCTQPKIALQLALQSTVLAYTIGHSFYVPKEYREDVLRKSGHNEHEISEILRTSDGKEENDDNFVFLSPRRVDTFIKGLIHPYLKVVVTLALKEYSDLCDNIQSSDDRLHALGSAAVLLVFWGTQQSKLVDKFRAGFDDFPFEQVHAHTKTIEERVVYPIIERIQGVWRAAADDEKRSACRHLSLLNASTREWHEMSATVGGTTFPATICTTTFGVKNIDRLLGHLRTVVLELSAGEVGHSSASVYETFSGSFANFMRCFGEAVHETLCYSGHGASTRRFDSEPEKAVQPL